MGLLGTAAKVAVASSVHGRVQRRQQRRWAEQDAQASWSEGAPAAAPSQPAGGGNRLEALQKLGELRDAGVLTDAEFEVEKAKILQG